MYNGMANGKSPLAPPFAKGGWGGIFALCLLPFAFCHAVYADAPPQSAVKAFNEGVKHFNAREFNEAIPLFDEAISADSDFADAYYARGACRYYLKGSDGALMDLGDAIRLKPELLDARALRGAVYYEADRWDQALEDFNYVLERHPTDAQSLLGRGVIYLKREQPEEAARDFRAFLKAHPDDALAPKLRKLLVSLTGGPAPGEESASAPPSSGAAPRRTYRRPTEAAKALGDSLMLRSHDLSERFGNKVLRGERAEAVGDIHSEPSAGSAPNAGSNQDQSQIVEPQ